MTAYLPDPSAKQRLSDLLAAMPAEVLNSMRWVLQGNDLVLVGHVCSYEEKRMMGQAALSAGFNIQNHLRVIPGARAA
jgi:hypothetical protein